MNPHMISDENLYKLCQQYGEQARTWRQKFAGLLPEVQKRHLYKKKGFSSIFEFAKKLAGMSEEQVRRVLNLEKKFEPMPILQMMLVNGEVSLNKLAKVASIATPENQQELSNQVKLLPCRALEVLVRDEKFEKSVHVNTHLQQISQKANAENVKIDQGDVFGFESEIKETLMELRRKGIDLNPIIREALARREQHIAQEKERLAASGELTQSPYIRVKTRKLLQQEHGTKCTINSCENESEVIHHTQRFGLSKNNNPHYLAPLCKAHHVIAHSIDVKFHQMRGVAR